MTNVFLFFLPVLKTKGPFTRHLFQLKTWWHSWWSGLSDPQPLNLNPGRVWICTEPTSTDKHTITAIYLLLDFGKCLRRGGGDFFILGCAFIIPFSFALCTCDQMRGKTNVSALKRRINLQERSFTMMWQDAVNVRFRDTVS